MMTSNFTKRLLDSRRSHDSPVGVFVEMTKGVFKNGSLELFVRRLRVLGV